MKLDSSNAQPTAKSPRMKNHLIQQKSLKKEVSVEIIPKTCDKTVSSPDLTYKAKDLSKELIKTNSLGLSAGDNSTCNTAPSNNKNSTGESSSKSSKLTIPPDLRNEYSSRTVEALNQFS